MSPISETWGTTPEERRRPFPCDPLVANPTAAYYRGVTVDAPSDVLFRWLCQLRVAPYSYDWLDNGGRKSPPELTPGLERLEVGQTFMRIFDLAGFEPGANLTLRLKPGTGPVRAFGELACTYQVVPLSDSTSRLLVKMVVRYPAGLYGRLVSAVLPWGDLVMMRRQFLNLKHLAEGTGRIT